MIDPDKPNVSAQEELEASIDRIQKQLLHESTEWDFWRVERVRNGLKQLQDELTRLRKKS